MRIQWRGQGYSVNRRTMKTESEGREWGVGSVVVECAFLGHPDFQSRGPPKPLFWRVSERFGAKIWGAPNADPTTTDPTPHSRPSVKKCYWIPWFHWNFTRVYHARGNKYISNSRRLFDMYVFVLNSNSLIKKNVHVCVFVGVTLDNFIAHSKNSTHLKIRKLPKLVRSSSVCDFPWKASF